MGVLYTDPVVQHSQAVQLDRSASCNRADVLGVSSSSTDPLT